jgi:hypothetical protein
MPDFDSLGQRAREVDVFDYRDVVLSGDLLDALRDRVVAFCNLDYGAAGATEFAEASILPGIFIRFVDRTV